MPTPDDELTNDEAALVFRRAAELDERSGRGGRASGPALTPAVIEQIAAEAGLSPANVRRALAELRAGTLTADLGVRRGALGPAVVVVERMLPLSAAEATAEVDKFLRRQLLQVLRNFGDRRVWSPRQGLGPSLSRSLDFNRKLVLNAVTEMSTAVAPEPGGSASCVRFEARLTGARRGYRVLSFGGVVIGAGGVAAAIALAGDPAALVSIPAGVGVAGGTYAAARAGYRSTANRVATALERFLDTLEHGPA